MHGSLKITRRRGGQVLSFVTGLIASVSASANPQGAQVVSGSAVFANPTPQTLEITNSPAAVLNWQSFDIGKGETTGPGLEQPVYYWDPVIAPSGMIVYHGDMFPEWKGSIFVGGLVGMKVVRLQMKDGKVAAEQWLLQDRHKRIRDVQQGADGAIYVLTESPLWEAGTFLGEVAVTRYPNLDRANVPYLIFPSYGSPSKTSWGYAFEFDLSYPHVWGTDWNLTQVTVFTHDVNGISPNTLPFVKGRKSLFVGFNFDKDSVWKLQAGYAAFFGGGLNNIIRDRDNLSLSLSYSF